jgi:WD40 repeat protein
MLNGRRWVKDLRIDERPDGFTARFSPDARWIAVGERARLATLLEAEEERSRWARPYVQNTETGEKFPFEGELPCFNTFSPDSRTLLTQSQYECCLYDFSTQSLPHHIDGYAISSPFAPDGKKLIVYCKQDWPRDPSFNGELRLHDVKTGELNATRSLFTEGVSHMVDSETGSCVNFRGVINAAPDGERVVTFDLNEKRAEIRDSRKLELLFQLPSDTRIWSAAWSRGGEALVLGGEDGTAVVWHRRRPEYWWGVAWLPEFWLTALFAGALGWSVWRDGRLGARRPFPAA